ncbi:MAG: hypothetical protein OEM52_13750, partial [bacterium]|nr:hypothetical protein [bacterium]
MLVPALAQAPDFLGIPFHPTIRYRPDPFSKPGKKLPALGESSTWLLGGPTPWFTTRTSWDTTYKDVTAQLLLNGKPFGVPERYTLEQYRKYRLHNDRQRLFREEAARFVSSQRVVEKEALEIQVPLKVKSKVFQRVFGGDRVGLRVNGELSINGEIRKESNDRNITQQGQQQQTNFKIDQRQRFTITGNIGDKVTL